MLFHSHFRVQLSVWIHLSVLFAIQSSENSEFASSEQLASELRVDSSVLNESSNSRQGHKHTQNHYHQFSEQKLHVRAEITSE